MALPATFEPSRYLTKISGSDYLEVKWRLVWLREAHPDAQIETELVQHDRNFAIFRAKVSIPGGGSATGWGSEGIDDFRDYIEKAETKAIGRALAALGFGTQFCPDFDFGAAAGKVVDAPIDFASTRGRRIAESGAARSSGGERRVASVDQAATPRQLRFLQAIAREVGIDDEALREEVAKVSAGGYDELSRRDASALIERLQARRVQTELAS
ncbi:MAG TPA: hypothetical protein VFQ80_09765 [Thermomicrobiales bacterium]|nr:hypothetical protein [Thermomicrobiales bacterium]